MQKDASMKSFQVLERFPGESAEESQKAWLMGYTPTRLQRGAEMKGMRTQTEVLASEDGEAFRMQATLPVHIDCCEPRKVTWAAAFAEYLPSWAMDLAVSKSMQC